MSLPSPLEPFRYQRGSFELIDQTLLPKEFKWVSIKNVDDGWEAINKMKVRGAPAIAICGLLCIGTWVHNERENLLKQTPQEVCDEICNKLNHLRSSRPTAVNLFNAIDDVQQELKKKITAGNSAEDLINYMVEEAERLFVDDVTNNKKMGKNGAARLMKPFEGTETKKISVLTHCNTGSLATAGYGTALGVIRALHEQGLLEHAYCTETRPYNQGSRLTALELVCDNIPTTLITDSMAGALMAQGKVNAIVVGADRIVANGDTANKIGTYSLAVLAKYHNVKFYIAAPIETLDPKTEKGDGIVIEQRSKTEVTHIKGIQIAPDNMDVWNPAFDVTPASLIEAIITDKGIIEKQTETAFNIPQYIKEN